MDRKYISYPFVVNKIIEKFSKLLKLLNNDYLRLSISMQIRYTAQTVAFILLIYVYQW